MLLKFISTNPNRKTHSRCTLKPQIRYSYLGLFNFQGRSHRYRNLGFPRPIRCWVCLTSNQEQNPEFAEGQTGNQNKSFSHPWDSAISSIVEMELLDNQRRNSKKRWLEGWMVGLGGEVKVGFGLGVSLCETAT